MSADAERWREIGREMSANAEWQHGVQVLALALHHAAERLMPADLRAYADETTARLWQRMANGAALPGLGLTDAQIDEVISALFWAAFDLTDTFSPTGSAS